MKEKANDASAQKELATTIGKPATELWAEVQAVRAEGRPGTVSDKYVTMFLPCACFGGYYCFITVSYIE